MAADNFVFEYSCNEGHYNSKPLSDFKFHSVVCPSSISQLLVISKIWFAFISKKKELGFDLRTATQVLSLSKPQLLSSKVTFYFALPAECVLLHHDYREEKARTS